MKETRPTLSEVLERVKLSGLKLTEPRKAILKILTDQHGPFTAEQIQFKIRRKACDQATIYRNLSILREASIVRRCEFGDGSARFELALPEGQHHHHVVCRMCQDIEVVHDDEVEKIDRFAHQLGYKEVSHLLEFFGICPKCQEL